MKDKVGSDRLRKSPKERGQGLCWWKKRDWGWHWWEEDLPKASRWRKNKRRKRGRDGGQSLTEEPVVSSSLVSQGIFRVHSF